jgi:chemotaxis protein MotA
VSASAAAAAVSLDQSTQARSRTSRPDILLLSGIVIAIAALVLGIAFTGVRLSYFFQPTGALIVLGGTLGVTLITTPRSALFCSARRLSQLFRSHDVNRELIIEDVLSYVRTVRTNGPFSIEPLIGQARDPFMQESLLLTVDVKSRADLQALLETRIRLAERHAEADAKTLEVAGGFAPTIGIMGTVVGLIDVLRQFSSVTSVASGLSTAFVSTIYGLALANLILLPAAHRIRAKAAEMFDLHELIAEGALCVFDRIHPTLVRERLNCFLRERKAQ